jgi:hypothetical protein
MSTTESDSSYQSDDSDVNFIPGYVVLEDPDLLNSSKQDSRHEDDDENVLGLAYSEEPLADEEWIRNYQEAENERIQYEENLRKRFDGSLEISEW